MTLGGCFLSLQRWARGRGRAWHQGRERVLLHVRLCDHSDHSVFPGRSSGHGAAFPALTHPARRDSRDPQHLDELSSSGFPRSSLVHEME